MFILIGYESNVTPLPELQLIGASIELMLGNFGDHKFCRSGVWELRIDVGAGYRVYYGIANNEIVLLLCGGDKRTQDSDIDRACEYWTDWQRRVDDER